MVVLITPAGVLQGGENRIAVANLEPSDAVGGPPYVKFSQSEVRLGGERPWTRTLSDWRRGWQGRSPGRRRPVGDVWNGHGRVGLAARSAAVAAITIAAALPPGPAARP